MTISFSNAESFRVGLEKAIRSDEDADWTSHTVDYGAFKLLLKDMAKRRVQLRKLIRESPNGRLSHAVLQQILNEPLTPPFPVTKAVVIVPPPNTAKDEKNNSSTSNNNSKDSGTPIPQEETNDKTNDKNAIASTPASSSVLLPQKVVPKSVVFPQGDFSAEVFRKSDNPTSPDQQQQHQQTPLEGHYQAMDQQAETPSFDAESVQQDPSPFRRKSRSKRSTMRKVSSHERSEMIALLLWEMDKVQLFYYAQWQKLIGKLEQLTGQPLQTSASWMENSTQKFIQASDQESVLLGEEILELFAFCVINIVTVCQILIRYDAYARTFEGTPMLDYFTKQVMKHPTSFRKIVYHEELIALADAFQRHTIDPSGEMISGFTAQREMFVSIIKSMSSTQAISVDDNANIADSFIKTVRFWIEFGAYEDQLGLEPAYLTMRGKSLTNEMKILADWRSRKTTSQPSGFLLASSKTTAAAETPKMNESQVYSLTLNLVSAFLYCMNYYIVEPSSTMYVNRLNAHDAMSGTLIGMMPLAAFLSSIPYSMWTNHSFRYPSIMSCTLLLLGNLTYSLADQFGTVKVALLGRFICGLGAPKCIIRRFLADTTPVSLRTSVNALFGMVVAAGSAMGPAMAVVLNTVEAEADLPIVGVVSFNGLTMPGYFMAGLWITFLVVVLVTFEEPNRDGLEEQKRLEEQRSGNRYLVDPKDLRGTSTPRSTLNDDLYDTNSLLGEQNMDLQMIFTADTFQDSGTTPAPCQTHHLVQGASGFGGGGAESFSSNVGPKQSLCSSSRDVVVPWYRRLFNFFDLVTLPVRICLGLLFAKVFTIEALVSATSALAKNRYRWQVEQVGTLGFVNGCLVIPFSILIGRMSVVYQDQKLMQYLAAAGCFGLLLLIDFSDLIATPTADYNQTHPLSVGPRRYIAGYFLSYLSIQAFEGVIGSALSKVIPTALASGTFNSGLLATLVDTLGRACGDMFISSMGFISLRQLMNLLFIPGFLIMLTCVIVIGRYRDLLAV